MKFSTKWSVADATIGKSQLAAFASAPGGPEEVEIQAQRAINLGRAQIVLAYNMDGIVKDAHALALLKTGAMTPQDFAVALATPIDRSNIGGRLSEAKKIAQAYGHLVGPIDRLYLMTNGVIRELMATARRTTLPPSSGPYVPPGGELTTTPPIIPPLPQVPPTGWPPEWPWPVGNIPGLPGELPTTQPPPTTGGPPSWWPPVFPWPGGTGETHDSAAMMGAVVPILIGVLGVAGIAGATYYGIESSKHGIKIKSAESFHQWQAWTRIQIAAMQLKAGQPVTTDSFVESAAAAENARSPWIWGAVGLGIGAVAALAAPALAPVARAAVRRARPAAVANPRRRARRPSSRRKQIKVGKTTVTVEVRKLKTGYRATYLGPTRKVPIAIPEVRTYDEAFREAGKALRRAKRRTSRSPKRNPKKATRKRTTKKKATRKRTTKKKATRKKTTRKRTTKKKTARKKNPAKRKRGKVESAHRKLKPKRKTSKRQAAEHRKAHRGGKDSFIRSQMRKGRSKKQAEAAWKGRRRLAQLRKKK